MSLNLEFDTCPVAVRLAGIGDFQDAPAGKPCCYGFAVSLNPESDTCPVAAWLASGSDLKDASPVLSRVEGKCTSLS